MIGEEPPRPKDRRSIGRGLWKCKDISESGGRIPFPIHERKKSAAALLAGDPKQLTSFVVDHQKAQSVEPPARGSALVTGAHIAQVSAGREGSAVATGNQARLVHAFKGCRIVPKAKLADSPPPKPNRPNLLPVASFSELIARASGIEALVVLPNRPSESNT